jgi:hypothetical protein
MVTVE